jgi:diguanylate cyclase (GGDEF)-like protein
VAKRLSSCVRETDTVSRFGGDEFLILCVDADGDDALELSRRIETVFREPFLVDGQPVMMGASIGIVCDNGATDSQQLIHRADTAMYAAKQERRDTPGVRAVAA